MGPYLGMDSAWITSPSIRTAQPFATHSDDRLAHATGEAPLAAARGGRRRLYAQLGRLLGLTCFAPLQPSLERGSTFCRLLTNQQAFNANILIEFRPMNAITCAADLKIGAFSQCAVRQARVPANGHRD